MNQRPELGPRSGPTLCDVCLLRSCKFVGAMTMMSNHAPNAGHPAGVLDLTPVARPFGIGLPDPPKFSRTVALATAAAAVLAPPGIFHQRFTPV